MIARISLSLLCLASFSGTLVAAEAERPNILWITSEDNGPELGCYGDEFATSPNIDGLAKRGLRYTRAWSTAPVCAPARTTIISGIYPPSTGSQHMRSNSVLPDDFKMFPVYLREAGYYCTNNSKEDYNLVKTGQVWDQSDRKAHWRNREKGQPFFAVFNFTTSHESQIRTRPHELEHDPAGVRVPAYHPDAPEVREDWAQYYDKVTAMDKQVGQVLKELEKDGLADNTIVMYYGDHGSGMPRHKRWTYNTGLHVPLVVHVPEKWKSMAPAGYEEGSTTDRLVGFIDLAPTVLGLAGVEPPEWMQGSAFMGPHETAPPEFMFGFRDRMDERYDMVRSVTDGRFIYIRNFMPHKVYGQYLDYMFQTPTTQVWRKMYDQGKLNEAQSRFWETKPPEEFYDLTKDQDEVNNLIDDPDHASDIARLREALRDWQEEIRDLGFLPEEEMHTRGEDVSPYEMGRDAEAYPFEKTRTMAELASGGDPAATPILIEALKDEDSAVRYWGILGIIIRGEEAVAEARQPLKMALRDPSSNVRAVAAEALGRYGNDEEARMAVAALVNQADLNKRSVFVVMLSLNALDAIGPRAESAISKLRELPTQREGTPARMGGYVPRLMERITSRLDPENRPQ
ncbi:MAG: sulfatase-like hydrolase/transferase [Pirellulaceae bacterium]